MRGECFMAGGELLRNVKLIFHEVPICSAACNQFLVCALFTDAPLVEHHDARGVAHGAQAVSHNHAGASAGEAVQALDDGSLIGGIE